LKQGWKELEKAEKLYRKMGDQEGQAYTHCALGGLARMLGRYSESGKHYQVANRLHRQNKDSFGTAYSYCGLGNVERMNNRLDSALVYFKKAEKLYKRIGDKVSYAYTLWSIGTTYKLMGQLSDTLLYFNEADKLFRSTGDLRGRSYASLGRAELAWLKGKDGEAERKKAEGFAKSGGYAWELLHARMMKKGKALPNAKNQYRRIGSTFYPKGLPVNWP
jgi:tetratricopeptide (TPR) repeat protein